MAKYFSEYDACIRKIHKQALKYESHKQVLNIALSLYAELREIVWNKLDHTRINYRDHYAEISTLFRREINGSFGTNI